MIVKMNQAITIDNQNDLIIRASPKDDATGKKKYFICEENHYNEERTHYVNSAHVYDRQELRNRLHMKKNEVLVIDPI